MSSLITPEQWKTIKYIELSSSILSSLGLTFIFVTFAKIKKLRERAGFRFIIYLCIGDFIWSITGLLAIFETTDELCQVLGFLYYYSYLVTYLWAGVFALNIYSMVVNQYFLLDRHEKKLILICFGLPIAISIIPLIWEYYGLSQEGCILKTLSNDQYLAIDVYTFFIPFFSTLTLNIFCYFRVYLFMKEMFVSDVVKKWTWNIIAYPIILIFCWGWLVVCYLYYDIKASEIFWLVAISVFCSKLQGFLNFLVYGMNKTVRQFIKEHFCKGFNNEKTSNELMNTSTTDITSTPISNLQMM